MRDHAGGFPVRLPFEPRPYEISRLDVAIPQLWRDETRAPVVVHLPIHHFLRAYATPEAVYMLDSTHHWARVVNGFSGASPHGFRQTMEALHALPESLGVAALAGLGVDLVAIHRSAPAASRRALAAFFEEAPWATVYHVGDEHLVRIDPASIPHESSFLIYGKGCMRSSSGRTARPMGVGLPATAWSLSRIPEAPRA